MGFEISVEVKKPNWLNNPRQRWNSGLVMAGNAWKSENSKYPGGRGPRTGTMRSKSNFRIVEEGLVMELLSTYYWKWVVKTGTGIFGPLGHRIYPRRAEFLVFKGSDGRLVFKRSVSGMRRWDGKLESIIREMSKAFKLGVKQGGSGGE